MKRDAGPDDPDVKTTSRYANLADDASPKQFAPLLTGRSGAQVLGNYPTELMLFLPPGPRFSATDER
jgi:hypothetical protein